MRAGKLDQRVTIQTATVSYNSYGEPITTWADTYTDWAEAVTTGGGEYYAAQKINASTEVLFRMRYTDDITVTNRIKWLSRYFSILSINHVSGAYRELLIATKEVV